METMKQISIRARITIWYSLCMLALTLILATAVILIFRYFLFSDAENKLNSEADHIAELIENEGDINRFISNKADFTDDLKDITSFCSFFAPDGNLLFNEIKLNPELLASEANGIITRLELNESDYLSLKKNVYQNDHTIFGSILLLMPFQQLDDNLFRITIIFLVIVPLFIFVVVMASLIIAGKALKPIDEITETAAEISRHDLSKRISVSDSRDEVGRLISTFNNMLERLEEAFYREKQFSSDASHELKTSLTVILANAEEGLSGEKSCDDYKQVLTTITGQSKKMNKIISQLLLLSKKEKQEKIVHEEKFELNELIENIICEMKEQADSFGVEIINMNKGKGEKIRIIADHLLITQMLMNIIGNGCKYGKPGGYVEISSTCEFDTATVKISDDGIGISESDLKYIFKRFYRVDKSHSDNSTGLGLSIVQWIVDVHNGKIQVESKINEGTAVTIKLPLRS